MKLQSKVDLIRKMIKSKKVRDAFVYEHVRNGIPFQIRTLREERKWTQGKLGEEANKPRNVITRLEDPNYGKLTLKTLFEIASAFDVGLLIKFVPFSRLLREYEDVSAQGLSAISIASETDVLTRWAHSQDRKPTIGTNQDTGVAGARPLDRDANSARRFMVIERTTGQRESPFEQRGGLRLVGALQTPSQTLVTGMSTGGHQPVLKDERYG